ncbi:MAG: MurR/RpiR family transcriptional regulator [Candidatus Accumulibacter sp.]|jgi:DNA-binding MurR/RpiR family transcriptional regulator|nr:MurR/RpiR family transcriptional regulator [Accumulibacter sp.]
MNNDPLLIRLLAIEKLTKHERTLADWFENSYPHMAFSNLEEISATNGVSKATVTRFVRRLGYEDFRAFSRALKEEVAQNFDSPVERSVSGRKRRIGAHPGDLLREHLTLGKLDLQRTLDQADDETFATVSRLVSNPERRLFLMSVATGRMLLGYFYLLTKYRRPNVCLLAGTDHLAHEMLDAEPSSVLLVTNFDRFPTSVLAVMKHFFELGAETILLTNRRSNPLLRYARHSLFIHSESETVFKSRCAMLVMLESLVAGMGSASREKDDDNRLNAMEALFRKLDIYLQKEGASSSRGRGFRKNGPARSEHGEVEEQHGKHPADAGDQREPNDFER